MRVATTTEPRIFTKALEAAGIPLELMWRIRHFENNEVCMREAVAGRVRNLRCTCCGSAAGRYQQFYNQDTGYGICRKCIEGFLKENVMTAEEIRDRYGIEGVNYAPKGLGLTPAEYLTAVNLASRAHYEHMQVYQSGLSKLMRPRLEYALDDVQQYWEQGYWPEHAFGTLYSKNMSDEELVALGFPLAANSRS